MPVKRECTSYVFSGNGCSNGNNHKSQQSVCPETQYQTQLKLNTRDTCGARESGLGDEAVVDLGIMGPGSYFGEISILTDTPCRATVTTTVRLIAPYSMQQQVSIM